MHLCYVTDDDQNIEMAVPEDQRLGVTTPGPDDDQDDYIMRLAEARVVFVLRTPVSRTICHICATSLPHVPYCVLCLCHVSTLCPSLIFFKRWLTLSPATLEIHLL
jgi:hypothetical protein